MNPQSPREELEIRITALLMGELPPDEIAALQNRSLPMRNCLRCTHGSSERWDCCARPARFQSSLPRRFPREFPMSAVLGCSRISRARQSRGR